MCISRTNIRINISFCDYDVSKCINKKFIINFFQFVSFIIISRTLLLMIAIQKRDAQENLAWTDK